MAQRRQKPTLESRQPLAFLPAQTVLGYPLRPTKLPAGRFRTERESSKTKPQSTTKAATTRLRYHWNDFFTRGSFFECRQLCLSSHGVLKVRTGHESINQSQPCWALPHQAKGSNTETRSCAHEQDVSTLTGT